MTQPTVHRVISVHGREHESSSVISNTPSEFPVKLDQFVHPFQYKNQKPLRIRKYSCHFILIGRLA